MSKQVVNNKFHLDLHWQTFDPFLFCAHHLDVYPNGENLGVNKSKLQGRPIGSDFVSKDGFRMYHGDHIPGFPVHPHKGFETITLVRQGFVDHADSLGAGGRYSSGDAQWMTAGKGIQHSEMFPLVYKDKENPVELLQLWLNLPRKKKNVPANYKMFWSEDVPMHKLKNATVEVIAGKFSETTALSPPNDSYANENDSQIAVWLLEIDKDGSIELPIANSEVNRAIYFYEGQNILLNEENVENKTGMQVDPTAKITLKNQTSSKAKLLVLQGRPIGEPVVQRGPFVMNSQEEIFEAIQEYQRTQFGGWSWDRQDMVHGDKPERFGKHANGKVDRPKST